ncbi:MAG: hypothetical protein WCI74_14840, partial [Actinomycetes bacterium]
VHTDHILFIAAGAFYKSKPADLLPELQGRFPLRVELKSLTQADFVPILKEPQKYRLGFDDSLDVVGVHGVGGLVGMLGIGLLATTTVNGSGANGLFSGGGFALLGKQAIASGATLVFAFVVTAVLALIVDKTLGLRVHANHERAGLDVSLHAESAYDYSGASAGTFAGIAGHASPGPFPSSMTNRHTPEEN